MCLKNITSGPNPTEQGEGWKVFRSIDGKLASYYFPKTKVLENLWIKDINLHNIVSQSNDEIYQTGFHIFEDKDGADALADELRRNGRCHIVVRKVRYRNITAKGSQEVTNLYTRAIFGVQIGRAQDSSIFSCVVAKEIFIEPEEDQQECA
jgi:hypothetical protein